MTRASARGSLYIHMFPRLQYERLAEGVCGGHEIFPSGTPDVPQQLTPQLKMTSAVSRESGSQARWRNCFMQTATKTARTPPTNLSLQMKCGSVGLLG
jgi:hypothetical protein